MKVENERIGTFCEKCRQVTCICNKEQKTCCANPKITKWTSYSELKRCENCYVISKPNKNENNKKSND